MSSALSLCESLLERERLQGADEALLAAKEAALEGLGQALIGWAPSEADAQSLQPRIKAVLAANRFALKWADLRARLGRIGQAPARKAEPPRPRIDLVH